MLHLAAFTASVANTGNVATQALADSYLNVNGTGFLLQENMFIMAAACMSATMQRTRIVAAHLRAITLPFIRPTNIGVDPIAEPRVADYRRNPFQLIGGEVVDVEVSQGGAGAERATVFLLLGQPNAPAPAGDIYTIRGTSTTAATANVWSTLAVTFADTIPQGTFVCVGLEHQSANGQGCRLNFENQLQRPGCVSINALGDRTHPMFRQGELGVWGKFRQTRMPIVEVLCNAADAVHEIYLDIMKIG